MKQEKDSSKEFIVLNALAFYTSRNLMVDVSYHPYGSEYNFKVFVDKDTKFTSYGYLADIASSHEVQVFDEGTSDEFTVHNFIVKCAVTEKEK